MAGGTRSRMRDSTRYRCRYLHIDNNTIQTVLDTTAIWDHLNSKGAYAIEYNAGTGGFWVLATDILDQYILFGVDSNFQNPSDIRILEGNPMGIAIGPSDELYLSYPERQILPD